MEEQVFKLREELVITSSSEGSRTIYSVFNRVSGETLRLNQNAYLVLRHFNGKRTPLEIKRHLEEKHSFILSPKALESYLDLFLDNYLFERSCLELYWERLGDPQRESLIVELKSRMSGFRFDSEIPFVESLVLNQALKALDTGNIIEAIRYLNDALRINPAGQAADSILREIEETIAVAGVREFSYLLRKKISGLSQEISKSSFKYALATAVVLFMLVAWRGGFISEAVNPGISLGVNRENSLRVIKTVSQQLVEDKSLALTRPRYL